MQVHLQLEYAFMINECGYREEHVRFRQAANRFTCKKIGFKAADDSQKVNPVW